MTMITQAVVDPHYFMSRAREIRAQVPFILSQWGLAAKFKRWRLAQDPQTGMVVLFGVLDNKYIATHTSTPFSNYFDPHLMRDLEKELQVQIISSDNDGLRYAFVLERGQIDALPKHIDVHPTEDKLIVRVVLSEKPVGPVLNTQAVPELLSDPDLADQTQNDRSVGSYLKVFNTQKPEAEIAQPQPVQSHPDVLIEIDKLNTDQ